jgi:hypothetical protein
VTDDAISKAVSTVLCEAPDCGDVATWWVDGKNGETCVLCGAYRALVTVERAHEAILALSPGERARFDELCEAWARESARE